MPDQSLIELLSGYAAAPFEYFGYGKRPPPRVGDVPVRSPVGFGFEDPEARAFADRPSLAQMQEAQRPSNGIIEGITRPGPDAPAALKDVPFGGAAVGLAMLPYSSVKTGRNIVEGGIDTISRWLGATHQLPGAKATDDLVYPTGKPDLMEINPNRLEQHDFLAPTGLAGMGSPVSALGREALRGGAKVGRPSERALLSETERSSLPGILANAELKRLGQEDTQVAASGATNAAQAQAELPKSMSWTREPMGFEQIASSGPYAMDAARAMQMAKGDVPAAKQLLIENKGAQNVIDYWISQGMNPRAFADPARAQAYWNALEKLNTSETPSVLLSDAGKRSSLPGMIANEELRRMTQEDARKPPGAASSAAEAQSNWYNSGMGYSPMLTSKNPGSAKDLADQALRASKGNYDGALALLKDRPEAADVLKGWREDGYSFRAYEDPVRAQEYWQGLKEFDYALPPGTLSSDTSKFHANQQRGSLPGMVQGAVENASRSEKVSPALAGSPSSTGLSVAFNQVQSPHSLREGFDLQREMGQGLLRSALDAGKPVIKDAVSVTKDNELIAGLALTIQGGTAYVKMAQSVRPLTISEIREIMHSIKREHPQVTEIRGFRRDAEGRYGRLQSISLEKDIPAAEPGRGDRSSGAANASESLKPKAVKDLYARQGLPVPGEDEQSKSKRRGFGGPVPNY